MDWTHCGFWEVFRRGKFGDREALQVKLPSSVYDGCLMWGGGELLLFAKLCRSCIQLRDVVIRIV